MSATDRPPESVPGWPAAAIAQVTETLPGATVSAPSVGMDRAAEIRWRSFRLAALKLSRAWSQDLPLVLEAMAFLEELAGAGVDLERTSEHLATSSGAWLSCDNEEGSSGAYGVVCREQAAPVLTESVSLTEVEPDDLPPSMRTRRRALARRTPRGRRSGSAEGLAIGRLIAAHPSLHVSGVPLTGVPPMLHVHSSDITTPGGVLLCLAAEDTAPSDWDCATSAAGHIENAVAATSEGWLVLAITPGGPRDAGESLLSLRHTERGLEVDELELGRSTCDGQECEPPHEGYCVECEGHWSTVSPVGPDCVERRPGGTWKALHVRMTDAWLHERVETAEECVDRFAIREGRFELGNCGPPASARRCESRDRPPP